MKKCNMCQETKPETEFFENYRRCKKCTKEKKKLGGKKEAVTFYSRRGREGA